jgi:pseudouridine-5'-phosphate glycosidase
MFLAQQAGIRVFATGGIGGVHREAAVTWDISSDLVELARTPVAVMCSGAKNILDVSATLELLETLGVPVIGYGTNVLPAFYLHSSGLRLPHSVSTPSQAAAVLENHWRMNGAGVVVANPLSESEALAPGDFARWLGLAEEAAKSAGVVGPELTPFLLRRIAELSEGRSLQANQHLVIANARLAAQIARALAKA